MSRIGNIPIKIVAGAEVSVDGDTIKVKGPLGELLRTMTGGIAAAVEDSPLTRPFQGTRWTRSIFSHWWIIN